MAMTELLIVSRYDGVQSVAQEVEEKSEVKHRTLKKLPKALSPQQVDQLLSKISLKCPTSKRNMAIFQTMLKAGLRVSEVCNLTPADVNLEKGNIYVQCGKGQKDRMLPIGQCLMNWLKKWDSIRPQQSQYFFCTLQGGQLDPRYLNQVLERLSVKSGVFIQDRLKQGPVHCHCLRHTYATDLLRRGLNLPQIQKLMGHASIATTQVYLYVSDEELDAAVKALG